MVGGALAWQLSGRERRHWHSEDQFPREWEHALAMFLNTVAWRSRATVAVRRGGCLGAAAGCCLEREALSTRPLGGLQQLADRRWRTV